MSICEVFWLPWVMLMPIDLQGKESESENDVGRFTSIWFYSETKTTPKKVRREVNISFVGMTLHFF